MLNSIKNAAFSGILALTALTAVPAAHADNLYLGLDNGHVGVGVDNGDDEDMIYRRDHRDYRDDRGYRDDRDYRRHDDFGPRCSPGRALDKADRMGVHDPRIRYVGERRIGVVGHRHGRTVIVTFGRAPNCPIIY